MLTLNTLPIQTKHTFQKGFTIVELIVIIVVIGILASIATVSYSGSQKRAQKSAFDASAQQVKLKLGDYFTDKNKYPLDKTEIDTYLKDTGSTSLATEFAKPAYAYYPTTNANGACSATVACEKYRITVTKINWSGGSSDTDINVYP